MSTYILLTHIGSKPRIGSVSEERPPDEELAAWYSAGRSLWGLVIPDEGRPRLERLHPSSGFTAWHLDEDEGDE